MNKLLIIFFVLIITNSHSYCQEAIKSNSSKEKINVLFIGNSLTYTNNLPELVKKNAKLKGITINIKMIAFPNYAIADHWNEGQVQKLISSKKYDFVIIQQGPSSQNEGRKMLIEYGKKYKALCELNDAKLCYFMVWPSLEYYHNFDAVIKNHTDAASINKVILLPVGRIWKDYIDSTNNNEYYDTDGFHPSIKGSQIAAKVIVEHLFPY
jgi:hypothetical protein